MRFRKNAQLGARLFLATDVNPGRRVFPDAHKRKPGLNAARFQRGDAAGQFALDLRGDCAPVNYGALFVGWRFDILGRHLYLRKPQEYVES